MMTKEKVFILGDSRTGTMSLHVYLKRHGFKSVHYYIEAANQKQPDHLNHDENWIHFNEFIKKCNLTAFSDYPTRSFYKEIYSEYPNSFFILTTRKSTEVWKASISNFLRKFDIKFDIDSLIKTYENINDEIRVLYKDSTRKFLEICIDDDIDFNSEKLSIFLDLDPSIKLSRENKTYSYDNLILSKRRTVFGDVEGGTGETIAQIEKLCGISKAMLSEMGWVYLVNDSNTFLQVQYGSKYWSEDEQNKTLALIKHRIATLDEKQIHYAKFIIPEKSIVYSEYMPKVFANLQIFYDRPANIISKSYPNNIFYLEDFLKDAKSYGRLYFRGDTHTNWFGSFFVYRFIAEYLSKQGFLQWKNIFSYKDLVPSIAQYSGDLYTQLDAEQKGLVESVWGHLLGEYGFECLIRHDLSSTKKQAIRVETPDRYSEWFDRRETIVYENPNHMLPKAVIFRDSTADFIHELLAEHFSRSVFVWHLGQVISEVIELEKPQVIIHIMAERFTIQYPTWYPFFSMSKSKTIKS